MQEQVLALDSTRDRGRPRPTRQREPPARRQGRHSRLPRGAPLGARRRRVHRDLRRDHHARSRRRWLNVGTYRQMVQAKNQVGLYLSPGKDARLHIERYWSRGEACEVVMCWGIDPALFIVACQTFPKTVSELDFAGGLMGRPVELVKGEVTSLVYPARAEIVAEGIIPPDSQKLEGPFGEFTGYYGRPEDLAFLVHVKAVHHRDNPILTHALMADYPANENSTLFSVARSARIWNDLDRLGVPGIRGVYSHPAAAGGWGMTVVSLEQRYAGHAAQALALAAQCPGGAYYAKG